MSSSTRGIQERIKKKKKQKKTLAQVEAAAGFMLHAEHEFSELNTTHNNFVKGMQVLEGRYEQFLALFSGDDKKRIKNELDPFMQVYQSLAVTEEDVYDDLDTNIQSPSHKAMMINLLIASIQHAELLAKWDEIKKRHPTQYAEFGKDPLLSIPDYFIKPIQRGGQLLLLFKSILEKVPEGSVVRQSIENSKQSIEKEMASFNELIKITSISPIHKKGVMANLEVQEDGSIFSLAEVVKKCRDNKKTWDQQVENEFFGHYAKDTNFMTYLKNINRAIEEINKEIRKQEIELAQYQKDGTTPLIKSTEECIASLRKSEQELIDRKIIFMNKCNHPPKEQKVSQLLKQEIAGTNKWLSDTADKMNKINRSILLPTNLEWEPAQKHLAALDRLIDLINQYTIYMTSPISAPDHQAKARLAAFSSLRRDYFVRMKESFIQNCLNPSNTPNELEKLIKAGVKDVEKNLAEIAKNNKDEKNIQIPRSIGLLQKEAEYLSKLDKAIASIKQVEKELKENGYPEQAGWLAKQCRAFEDHRNLLKKQCPINVKEDIKKMDAELVKLAGAWEKHYTSVKEKIQTEIPRSLEETSQLISRRPLTQPKSFFKMK